MSDLLYAGTDCEIDPEALPEDLVEALVCLFAPGDATSAVLEIMDRWEVTGDPDNCRAYLEQYGAWEGDELADHKTNLQRLVWLTGCDLAEKGSAYFTTY